MAEVVEIEGAIRHFRNELEENQITLDQCGEQGVNPLVYESRKRYLEIAISALEWQRAPEQKELCIYCHAYAELRPEYNFCPYCKTELKNLSKLEKERQFAVSVNEPKMALVLAQGIQLVKGTQTPEPQEPRALTLEELKQRDKKYVWVEDLKNSKETGWGLVNSDWYRIYDHCGRIWSFKDYDTYFKCFLSEPRNGGGEE